MQQSNKQKAQLNTQLNADVTHRQKYGEIEEEEVHEIVQVEKIGGTPFAIVGNQEDGYFLAFGQYRLTEKMDTIGDVEEYYHGNQMTVIMQMVVGICHRHDEIRQEIKKVIHDIDQKENKIKPTDGDERL